MLGFGLGFGKLRDRRGTGFGLGKLTLRTGARDQGVLMIDQKVLYNLLITTWF